MKSVIEYSPKEKALELFENYKIFVIGVCDSIIEKTNAKRCAIIAVEEILKLDIEATYLNKQKRGYTIYTHTSFWKEVINEIKNI